MRASVQCDIALDGCRVGADALLPEARGLRGPFTCLNEARYGIIWGVMGAARSAYETALDYTREREQFGRPIAAFQLVQQQLAEMMIKVAAARCSRCISGACTTPAGSRRRTSASASSTTRARRSTVARTARGLLGGNGITLEHPVMRHMVNLEAPLTYEGTPEIHTLILGHALTGLRAFS